MEIINLEADATIPEVQRGAAVEHQETNPQVIHEAGVQELLQEQTESEEHSGCPRWRKQ